MSPDLRAVVATLAAVVGLVGAPGPAHTVLQLSDSRITEASGFAVATREPGVYFTHNDSGDAPRFFALAADGHTIAAYRVTGAAALDWEDMAAAPGPGGAPTLWFADSGDNGADRTDVTVYTVPEPRVDPAGRDGWVATPPATGYQFRYPDGPHDAETLLVDPHGPAVVLVTKSLSGTSGVYRAPVGGPAAGVRTLSRVGTLHWRLTGGRGGPAGPFGALTATGGAVSRDGRLAVVRTYTDAYVWRIGAAGLVAALREPPAARLRLPSQPQGEAVAFTADDRSLLVAGEGADTAVLSVPLPTLGPAGGGPPGSPGPSGSPSAPSAGPGDPGGGSAGGLPTWGYAVAAVAVLGIAGSWWGRRRR